jgi:hypothetical protein
VSTGGWQSEVTRLLATRSQHLVRPRRAVVRDQQRQLAYIAEYTSDLRHVPGSSNVVADALSHPAAAMAKPAPARVDLAALAAAQATCIETQKLAADSPLQVEMVHGAGVQLS